MCGLFQFKQLLITEATQITITSQTLIDHIYTNRRENIVNSGVITTGLSDHRLVFCVRRAHKVTTEPKYINTRSYKKFNKVAFLKDLEVIPWSCIEAFDDVNDIWGI